MQRSQDKGILVVPDFRLDSFGRRSFQYAGDSEKFVIVDKDFILQLMPISAIDNRLCQRVKSFKHN